MKIFIKAIIAVFLIYTSNVTASDFTRNVDIFEKIKFANQEANIGIKIKNLKTNEILYQQNQNKYYNFASSLKMITVFSLLKYFGLDYSFTSEMLKKDQNYYLNVNDPDFSTEDLEFLIGKLAKNKPFEIKGNFYIIDHKFILPVQVESRIIEDGNYCYGAQVTKVRINKNCIRLIAKAADQLKKSIFLSFKELVPYRIINKTHTISERDLPKIKTSIKNDELIISGTLNISDEEINIGIVVNDSYRHTENMVRATLLKSNIILKGQILTGSLPHGTSLIASVNKSYSQIGSKALKKSDNFITDYILAEFGSKYAVRDWRDCGKLLIQLVSQEFNVDLARATIADGSGLSRYNMITVNQFDDFLSALYLSPDFDELLPMLAMPNENGTLRKRFSNMRIFAKTGGMTGISSIVSYVFDANNVPYSFVTVANNYFGSKQKYNELYEAIIKATIINFRN